MENKKINQREAIKMLQESKDITSFSIEFTEEKIEALEAILLGKNNVEVPEELIYYNDDAIDFSDDPDITDEDFETGKLVWNINASLPVDNEIREWIKSEKIDVNNLLTQLMSNFYKTVKNVQKNAAL